MNSRGADLRARQTGAWRHALLASTALAVASPAMAALPLAALFAALSATATMADGGAGSAGSVNGGAGGIDSPTGPGGTGGAAAASFGGGGGGGAGATGGGGGNGHGNLGVQGPGGAGGSSAGSPGSNGGDGPSDFAGGGGGGGGAHGSVDTPLPGAASTGGAGGAGGNGADGGSVGGGGGAGGYGAVVTGTGSLGTLGAAVTGGTGGSGGTGGDGGNGGSGGVGLFFDNAAGATFTVNAAVQGGAGGVGGFSNGTGGAGGAGIVGRNLTIANSGTIIGGLAGDGVTRADAITFTGGANRLELHAGSIITGNVVAFSAADTLALGGAGNASFDVSQIGPAAQYRGFGAYEKTGASTWTLTGTTTAVTPWTINQGTLSISADNNLGSAAGALGFGGGTLRFNGSFSTNRAITLNAGGGTFDTNGNAATLSGSIGGGGGLTKTGAGMLTLTGASSYSGATNVNAGTLQAGAANTFSAGSAFTVASGAVLNLAGHHQSIGSLAGAGSVTLGAATLTAGGDDTSTTFSGTISGSGGLTKSGAGTLTLAGANSYSGGTTLAAGTLRLANDLALGTGTLTTTGSVVDYAAGITIGNSIVINSNSTQLQVTTGTTTQAGVISEQGGPRPLEKIGAGTLVLTATSTYTGATTVSAGTLVVDGDITSSSRVTVNDGALLTGSGTVGATTINSGGMFAPGSGTPGSSMTVAGNLAFQSGAFYLVQVDPSSASRANVTAGGSATLAGTAIATFAPGSYVTRNYTILSAAGGLGGTTFDALATGNLPAGFIADLSYTNSSVILNLTAALGTAGLGGNQRNVAGALNDFFNGGGALPPSFVAVFGLTGGSLGNALTQLSGEAATGAQQGAFQLGGQFLNLMLDPFVDGRGGVGGAGGTALGFAPERPDLPDDIALAYAKVTKAPSFEPRWTAWGGAYGGYNKTNGDPSVTGSHDLTARTAGVAAGMDYRVAPGTVVGFALAGGGTNWSLAQGLGGGKSDAFQAGVYGSTRSGPLYVAAALAYAWHDVSTDRIAFAANHLAADFTAQSFGARVEGGYRYATMLGGLTPYAALQAQSFRTPGYAERDLNGGGFALSYNARTGTATRSELGARFDHAVALDPTALLTLRARAAWAHDWVSDPALVAGFQALPGTSFIVNGATPAKDSALASAGAELRLANGVALLGKLDGEFAARAATYSGTATVRVSW